MKNYSTDCTAQRKKAEEKLHADEALLRQFVESVPAAIEMFDNDMRYLLVSDRFLKDFGFQGQDIIGRSHYEVFPESIKWKDIHQRGLAGETVICDEDLLIREDGAREWLRWEVQPWRDKSGRIGGIIIFSEVITRRKAAETLGNALNSINSAISSTLEPEEIMRAAAVEATKALGADSATVSLREEDHWFSSYVHNLPASTLGLRYTSEDGPALGLVAESLAPATIDDLLEEENPPEFATRLGIRSIMLVPLVVRSEVTGILHFHRHEQARPFTALDLDFGRKLGTSVSLALENARLFEAERAAAMAEAQARMAVQRQFALLQQALIPEQPQIGEGYEVAAVYASASEGQEIGGDFYDVFRTEDGKIGILVGDVAGKDIEAAEVGAATRNTARAFTYELCSAAKALTHTNAVVSAQPHTARLFSTVFLAVMDRRSGRMCYSSAGHPPPVIYRADGSVEFLTFGQPPIGVVEGMAYEEAAATLEAGDKLLLYTDGISEARDGGEMFDLEGIERTLLQNGHRRPAEIAQAMVEAARDWACGNLRDDIALIVVERKAGGSV